MDVAIWTGFIVVLVISVAFMGPGLWSESLDYPVVNWVRRMLGKDARAPKLPPAPESPKADDTAAP